MLLNHFHDYSDVGEIYLLMDDGWLVVQGTAVLVDLESHSFDCLALDALRVLVVGRCCQANYLPVGVVDLPPELEEAPEHDLVAFVHDQDAVLICLDRSHALEVV